MNAIPPDQSRETIFVTHAAPEDNEFALWLSSKLTIAGYRVWIDRRRLRGGNDTWNEIDQVLRHHAIKQIVVFSEHVRKPGVATELGIGSIVRNQLDDPDFMIAVRIADVAYSNAPPEFVRTNILNGYPNWHDCLADLFKALEPVQPKPHPDQDALRRIVEAREDGRRFVLQEPERLLTNWFTLSPPPRVRYYRYEGLQDRLKPWLAACHMPHVQVGGGRLIASFADPVALSAAGPFPLPFELLHDLDFEAFVSGEALGPYVDRRAATNDVVNLLRQHFDVVAAAKGLRPLRYASGETGWYFPDGLATDDRISFVAPDGRRIRRTVAGKFKSLRWRLCLLAKPRLWPEPMFRIHGNVALSDGAGLLDGERAHARRRRLTRSWWNDVWRDRLLCAMRFLAEPGDRIELATNGERFGLTTWPTTIEFPVSYAADDPEPPSEENDRGDIVPSPEFSATFDDPESDDE
ncbi:TIR domain-containing protein [Methylopila jiangsuensis]|uniref:TIR domain-containing protein n=1 Tax=Methylopila jiangsuensis TaxID=586230 RepID=A0A9W6N416_9HYPH|nr:TIR domain-containing protein [Methylopila jiangsuensis]